MCVCVCVSMPIPTFTCFAIPVSSNDYDSVPGPSAPLTAGAEGGCQSNEDCLPNNLDLGKYAKENVKNINVDTKHYNDQFV